MRAAIRIRRDEVIRFAEITGDRNPLHIDPLYSKKTLFGQPIVHGALASLCALSRLPPSLLEAITGLQIIFHHPVYSETEYVIKVEQPTAVPRETILHLGLGELLVVTLRCITEPCSASLDGEVDATAKSDINLLHHYPADGAEPRVLRRPDIEALPEDQGFYNTDLDEIEAIVRREGDASIPASLITSLAFASFWTGMQTPGRDALLCDLSMQSAPFRVVSGSTLSAGTVEFRADKPWISRRTGFVSLTAVLDAKGSKTKVAINSLLRNRAPQATLQSMGLQQDRVLPMLKGQRIAVIGATRGLGRALVLGLLQQQADVLAVYRPSSAAEYEELMTEAGEHVSRLQGLECDAGQDESLMRALDSVEGRFSGLILTAAPPIRSLSLSPGSLDVASNYIEESLRLVWAPISAFSPLLEEDATVTFLSSSALEDPPELWPHYVVAKQAVEGLAAYIARHRAWRIFVARPPRFWTDLTNTVTASLHARTVEEVASNLMSCTYGTTCRVPFTRGQAVTLTAGELSECTDTPSTSK